MPKLVPPVAGNRGCFRDPSCADSIARIHATFKSGTPNALPGWLHAQGLVDDARSPFRDASAKPQAMSRRVRGFVRAPSWLWDLLPITLG